MPQFYVPHSVLIMTLISVFVADGFASAFLVLVLAVLEISLSVDNAVVNAGVLKNMDVVWQQRFLTWGILIAVFGMRLLMPVMIVAFVTGISVSEVVSLAINSPDQYAQHLHDAHPTIASLGGMFLMMVGLSFLVNENRDIHWIGAIEKHLQSLGKIDTVTTTISLGCLLLIGEIVPHAIKGSVLAGGLIGILLYGVVSSLDSLFPIDDSQLSISNTAKRGGVIAFLYLEVLDASFSFDGVIGAFAISADVLIIMLGLGIGALYVRSLTIYLVKKGVLDEFIFLEHGAHYAILALAILMMIGTIHEIPEVITGVTGATLIGLSLWSSIGHKKQKALVVKSDSFE